ncbi:MAG: UDP-glucose/GDP-mannose dehydrogenase family protein [Candidatus Niyogibacteria bacterium]|nr:UDP-glucose/GDP-mannose dehydrogenase family protein [Candidatus Niyogibacteria bacterium]
MNSKKEKIGIVGVGWVGSVVKRWFLTRNWEQGKNLFCYDCDLVKIDDQDDISRADIIFICVPTPNYSIDGSCNTQIVRSVVAQFAGSDKLVVIKSTVEPGTTERLEEKYNVAIAFNPEFLTEENAWQDFVSPCRQVVGYTDKSKKWVSTLVSLLPEVSSSYALIMPAIDAEIAKYSCNMFGAMKVSFANAIAALAENAGANYKNIRRVMAEDIRIGDSWLDIHHGGYLGFGGYCFPKDASALISWARKIREKMNIPVKDGKDLERAVFARELVGMFLSIYKFNEALLALQGLTIGQVSGHIKRKEK